MRLAPGDAGSTPRAGDGRGKGRSLAWILGLVALAALLPSWGSLDSPWIAEDAAILARVHEQPPGADLLGPQYGLHLVRFWRPVVTLSWWLQEHTTGIATAPLRAFNLALHVATALGLALLVIRLGARPPAALAAGLLAAVFPEQGGTVTWIAGRTDLLVGLGFVGTLLCLLGGRRVLACLGLFLACATKEFAFVLPAWGAALVWAQDPEGDASGRLRRAWAATWPLALVAAAALVLRRGSVGSWTGGYAGGAAGLDAFGVLQGLGHGLRGVATLLGVAVLCTLLGLWGGAARLRIVLAGFACALAGLAPLSPLLEAGPLGPQNVRLLWIAELGLCIAVGGALADLRWRSLRPGAPAAWALGVALVGVGLRAQNARTDVREWSHAAEVGESAIRRATRRASEERPSSDPLLWNGFPGTVGGAYCLGFGLVDRFRAPFPESARPVWPERPLFHGADLRASVALPDGEGFRDPFEPGELPLLEVAVDGDTGLRTVTVDERVPLAEPDRSPRLSLRGGPPGAPLEALLWTESGGESAFLGQLDAAGAWDASLSQLCTLPGASGIVVGQALVQTADLGATRAVLELRALDASGAPVAAAPALRLLWEPGLLDEIGIGAP